MRLRVVPPAWSPLSLGALGAGLVASLGRDRDRGALTSDLLREFDADLAVLLDSGTSALAMALDRALAGSATRIAALPAYCCYDLVTAARAANVRVRFYDVEPSTLQPDLASLGSVLSAGAGAVVFAHLFGIPVDPDPFRGLAAEAGALLIEDAAQGFGCAAGGVLAGAMADLSVLSFNRGKGVTGGRGGALLLRGALAADSGPAPGGRAGFGDLAIASAAWVLARPALYGIPRSLPGLAMGETRYRPPHPVRTMSRGAAGVVLRTWPLAREAVAPARSRAARLLDLLDGVRGVDAIAPPPSAEPSFLRLPVRFCGAARERAERAMPLGVARGYPRALPDLAESTEIDVEPGGSFPGARKLAESLYTLPTHARVGRRGEIDLERWIERLAWV